MGRKMTLTSLTLAAALLFAVALSASDTVRERTLQQAIDLLEKRDLAHAMPLLEEVAKSSDRALAARGRFYLAQAQERQGSERARANYEKLVKEFSDQKEIAAEASRRLSAMEGGSFSTRPLNYRIANGAEIDEMASIAMDGKMIAGADPVTTGLGIWDVSNGELRRRKALSTPDEESLIGSAILSPDQQRVAYVVEAKTNRAIRLSTCKSASDCFSDQLRVRGIAPDSKPQVLVDHPEFSYPEPFAWSRDGNFILITAQKSDSTWQLVRVSVADGTATPIKSLDWRLQGVGGRPSLSPDGKYIAYAALANNPAKRPFFLNSPAPELTDQHIYVVAVDGSSHMEVVGGDSINESPVWTPDVDGERIVFVSNRSNGFALWSVPIRNGKPSGAPSRVKSNIAARVSPIGLTKSGSYYYITDEAPFGSTDVFVMDLPAKGEKARGAVDRILDNSADANYSPAWSPNGKFIAFKRPRALVDGSSGGLPRQFDLVVYNIDTRKEKTYPYLNEPLGVVGPGQPIWFHDSASILIRVTTTLFRVDLSTGQFRVPDALFHSALPRSREPFALAPDDKTLYMADPNGIVAWDTSGRQNRVWQNGTSLGINNLSVSPDGRKLAMIYRSPDPQGAASGIPLGITHLAVVGTDGRGFEDLTIRVMPDTLTWTQDSGGILFAADDELMRIWITSKKSERVGVGLKWTSLGHSLSLNPDGTRMVFSQSTAGNDLWVLENLPSALKSDR